MSRNGTGFRRCCICGREFDMRRGGRYEVTMAGAVCPECLSRQGTVHARRVQFVKPGMGGTILKCAFGLVFILTAFGMEDALSLGVGLVMGLALIVWGVWPWLRLKAEQSRAAKEAALARARESELLRAKEERERNAPKICPHCGAATRGKDCEYCGSPLN